MYEELNVEEVIETLCTRVEVIRAMELERINAEDVYQMIKDEMKEVKKCRKKFNKDERWKIVSRLIMMRTLIRPLLTGMRMIPSEFPQQYV